jgi:hypothetical protein
MVDNSIGKAIYKRLEQLSATRGLDLTITKMARELRAIGVPVDRSNLRQLLGIYPYSIYHFNVRLVLGLCKIYNLKPGELLDDIDLDDFFCAEGSTTAQAEAGSADPKK